MRSVTWFAGLGGSGVLALLCAVYGCSSTPSAPPVLDGTGDSGHPSSSSGGSSGSGSGSGSSSGGSPMCLAGPDGGCTDLQLCGAKVDYTNVLTGTPPTPMGGTILPGTYVLTKVEYYASGGGWLKQTMRITASGTGGDGGAAEGGGDAAMASDDGGDGALADGASEDGSEGGGTAPDATVGEAGAGDGGVSFAWENVEVTDTDPNTVTTTSGTLSVPSANTIDIEYACPSSGSYVQGYTATATTLAIIIPAVPNQNPDEVLTYTKQ